MTQDEIIELTRQAGGFAATPKFLETFAKLVAAKEREACAKICDNNTEFLNRLKNHSAADETNDCAKEIRARGNK